MALASSLFPRFFFRDSLPRTSLQPRFTQAHVEGMTSFSELAALVALSSLSFATGEVCYRVGPVSDVLGMNEEPSISILAGSTLYW